MLHQIFQRQGIPPDEVMAKPPGVRALMFASIMVQIENENNPKGGREEE